MAKSLGGVHISSGELLRRDATTANSLNGGKLAPADLVQRLVGESMDQVPQDQPIILDGTPRTMSDVLWLAKKLPECGRTLTAVILLKLDLATSLKRLQLRERPDDNLQAVQEKYAQFKQVTGEAIDYYRKHGQLQVVDGRGSIEEVHELVKAVIQ